jgi:hypothetical protein
MAPSYRSPPAQINTKLLKSANKIVNMNSSTSSKLPEINSRELINISKNNRNHETKKKIHKTIPQNKLEKKSVEYKTIIKPPMKFKKKKIYSNKNVETLSSVIFILAFVVLILTLLIFFRHFR